MAPKFNPAEFVDVFNHEARMLVGPRCDFHPDRPKPERGVHVWPGLALLPGHNVVALDPEWSTMADHTTIRRWLELGMIEERMPDIEATTMVEEVADAVELVKATEDFEQLSTWLRNEFREPVRKVLAKRVEQTEEAYLARQREESHKRVARAFGGAGMSVYRTEQADPKPADPRDAVAARERMLAHRRDAARSPLLVSKGGANANLDRRDDAGDEPDAAAARERMIRRNLNFGEE